MDPAIKIPLEIIMQWIVMLHHKNMDMNMISADWAKLDDKLRKMTDGNMLLDRWEPLMPP
eukprot:7453641-Heterocapsa_arctica.AAC.1